MTPIGWIISLILALVVMYAFTTGSSSKKKAYDGLDGGDYTGSVDGDCGSGDGGCDGGGD